MLRKFCKMFRSLSKNCFFFFLQIVGKFANVWQYFATWANIAKDRKFFDSHSERPGCVCPHQVISAEQGDAAMEGAFAKRSATFLSANSSSSCGPKQLLF